MYSQQRNEHEMMSSETEMLFVKGSFKRLLNARKTLSQHPRITWAFVFLFPPSFSPLSVSVYSVVSQPASSPAADGPVLLSSVVSPLVPAPFWLFLLSSCKHTFTTTVPLICLVFTVSRPPIYAEYVLLWNLHSHENLPILLTSRNGLYKYF